MTSSNDPNIVASWIGYLDGYVDSFSAILDVIECYPPGTYTYELHTYHNGKWQECEVKAMGFFSIEAVKEFATSQVDEDEWVRSR